MLKSVTWRTVFDIKKKIEKAKELERETQRPDFWQNREKATKVSQELADSKEEIAEIKFLDKEIKDLEDLNKITIEGDVLTKELARKIRLIEEKIKEKEKLIFLFGKIRQKKCSFFNFFRRRRPGCPRLDNDVIKNVPKIFRKKRV